MNGPVRTSRAFAREKWVQFFNLAPLFLSLACKVGVQLHEQHKTLHKFIPVVLYAEENHTQKKRKKKNRIERKNFTP